MDKAVKKRLSKEQKRYLFLGAIILAFFILFSIRIPNFFSVGHDYKLSQAIGGDTDFVDWNDVSDSDRGN